MAINENHFSIDGKIMALPDLHAMALFVRVVEHGSFSEASRRSGVPVSTVSRKVSELEKSLGLRLLQRSTRSLRTTEAGREYFECCRRGLEEFETANANATHHRVEVSGTLRLAAPPSLSEIFLVPLIQSFLQRYPKVAARVLVTDRHLELVEDEVDISLRVGRQPESSLVFRRLMRYRHILVAAPSYLAGAGRLEHPADLKNHRLLGFTKWFEEVSWKLSKGGDTQSVPLKLWLGINDYSGVLRAAVSGMGVAEVPSILCQRELQEGSLVGVMPEWQFEPVDLSAFYLTRRHHPRVVELFLDHCSEQATRLLHPR